MVADPPPMVGVIPAQPPLTVGSIFTWQDKFYLIVGVERVGSSQRIEYQHAKSDEIDQAIMNGVLYRLIVNKEDIPRKG